MHKTIVRYFLILTTFLFLLVLFSPFFALFLPKKLRNHTYAEMVYQVIADEETKYCRTKEEKVLKLLDYVITHIIPESEVYEGKPLDYLIFAQGYCDYRARALNSLLGRLNIASRYAMLVDKDGSSPHTINEVLINEKWVLIDSTFNVEFKYGDKYFDTIELKRNPDFIGYVLAGTSLTDVQKQAVNSVLLMTLPFENNWRRSTPRIKQYHVVDYLIGLYVRSLGSSFSHFYQDFYLRVSLRKIPDQAQKFFLMARHYHILYRRELAKEYYERVIKNFPQSKYANDCMRLKNFL